MKPKCSSWIYCVAVGVVLLSGSCGTSNPSTTLSGGDLAGVSNNIPQWLDTTSDPNFCGAQQVTCGGTAPGCCNSNCVDFASDTNNCGQCSNVCATGGNITSTTCTKTPGGAGVCTTNDLSWYSNASGDYCDCACRALNGSTSFTSFFHGGGDCDPSSCGCTDAINSCSYYYESDFHSQCAEPMNSPMDRPCPSDYKNCRGTCRYLSSDPENCGSCGNACSAGQVCANGSCVAANYCPQSLVNNSVQQIRCPVGGLVQCVDPSQTPNCGGCVSCGTGQVCLGGVDAQKTNANQYQCVTATSCTQDSDCQSPVGRCLDRVCVYNNMFPQRQVFVTSNTYGLPLTPDQSCASEALSANLSGRFRALLATTGKSLYEVASQFLDLRKTPNLVYKDAVRGALISGSSPFESLEAIKNGQITPVGTCSNILPEIDCIMASKYGVPSEVGTQTPNTVGIQIWSGSPDGSFYKAGTKDSTCSDWSTTTGNLARVASTGSQSWSSATTNCSGSYHLLCIETD